VETLCNGLVPGWNRTRNRPGNLEPLLTLAMSHRSDLFACSSIANIWQHKIRITITLLSAFSRFRLPSFPIATAMSDSKSIHSSLLEVMMSSENEHVIIWDMSDITLQIIFDAWWASMNVASKSPIAWNNSTDASSGRFYLFCVMEETGNPRIICIICHQVLRHPSEYGTSSMGKHLLAKAHISK